MQKSAIKCSKIFQIIDFSIYLIPFLKSVKINLLFINVDTDFVNALATSKLIDFKNENEKKSYSEFCIINSSKTLYKQKLIYQ